MAIQKRLNALNERLKKDGNTAILTIFIGGLRENGTTYAARHVGDSTTIAGNIDDFEKYIETDDYKSRTRNSHFTDLVDDIMEKYRIKMSTTNKSIELNQADVWQALLASRNLRDDLKLFDALTAAEKKDETVQTELSRAAAAVSEFLDQLYTKTFGSSEEVTEKDLEPPE